MPYPTRGPTVQEDTLSVPFDVSLTPPGFEAGDHPEQQAALDAAVFAHDTSADDKYRFDVEKKQTKSLAYFRQMYEHREAIQSLYTLSKRTQVDFRNSPFVTSPKDRQLSWSPDNHFLDLMICVSNGLGLGALLPNLQNHPNYEMTLDLKQPVRGFSTKFAKLGFDPRQSMLWIGRSPASEDVWLAWIPRRSLMEGAEDVPVGKYTGNTQLSTKHYRMSVMFLSTMLRDIGVQDIVVWNDGYPSLTDDDEFHFSTNLLERTVYLKLTALRTLDTAIVENYERWVHEAPPSYREDGFLTERYPVAITSRYGQNQELGLDTDDIDEESSNWNRDRKFDRIRYMTVAIATHLRVRTADSWRNRSVEEIINQFPDGLFTAPNQYDREEIRADELAEYPLSTEDGDEIPIYSEDGYPIQRRIARFLRTTQPHGPLIDFTNLHTLFVNEEDNVDIEEGIGRHHTNFTVYPQAGLKSVGHFQAKGLMTPCYKLVERINRRLAAPPANDDDDDVDMDWEEPDRPAVCGIASQGYNSVMHHTRGRTAQHHDAQVGLITAALAGGWATNEKTKQEARKLSEKCQHSLPHQSFATKIENPQLSRDLRLENVYSIDLQALQPRQRNGRTILQDILLPLGYMWTHSSLLDKLKTSVVLFKPEAYPAVYNWTTYPLTSLLEVIYRQSVGESIMSNNVPIKDTLLVELCSVAERALNYMHTGNAAVISTTVMNPLWIGRAIIQDGLPCLNPRHVATVVSNSVNIHHHQWPYNEKKHQPFSPSEKAQTLTYGKGHFNVFFAHMCMTMATRRPPLTWIADTHAPTMAAKTIAFHLFITFIQDCKDLVHSHVRASIKQGLKSPQLNIVEHAQRRQTALHAWNNTLFALAWNTDDQRNGAIYGNLMIILGSDPDSPLKKLSHSKETWSYETLANSFLTMAESTGQIRAPVVAGGSFINALPVAVKYIKAYCTRPDTFRIWIVNLLARVMKTMQIHFVPWKKDTRSSRVPHADHWMIIKAAVSETTMGNQATLTLSSEEVTQEQAKIVADKEPSAPWSIPDNLHEMRDLWKKVVLPDDWNLEYASLENIRKNPDGSYVSETYDYVHREFTGENWIHHMALIWAILFSRVAPHLFMPKDSKIAKIKNSATVTAAIRNLPWVAGTSKNHKGTTARQPLVTMMTTALIGFLDDQSPFAKYLNSHSNHQGKAWTDKHGTKEIHAVNYIRMGLAQANTDGVMGGSKYKNNWQFLSRKELKEVYTRICGYLKEAQYGEYFAIRDIFGQVAASRLATAGDIIGPANNS